MFAEASGVESQTVTEPVKEIVLGRLKDVVKINGFIASRPEYATLMYKTSKSAGLWELEIVGRSIQWAVGHNVDRYGDVALEHSVAVRQHRHGYVDAKQRLQYVVRWRGGLVFTTLPNESEKKVLIAAPQVCVRACNPLMEPVYIWKDATVEWYEVLDCRSRFHIFLTLEELENWLYEEAEGYKLPWAEWYVIPGEVDLEDKWFDVVKRAEPGHFGPNVDEVIDQVLQLT
jgi:hypothetical protein